MVLKITNITGGEMSITLSNASGSKITNINGAEIFLTLGNASGTVVLPSQAAFITEASKITIGGPAREGHLTPEGIATVEVLEK